MNLNSLLVAALATSAVATAQNVPNAEPSMMRGIGWRTDAIFTVGEFTVDEAGNPFQPTGILDGMGAFQNPTGPGVAIYVNNEHVRGAGRPYSLANGTMITGARITKYVVERNADGSGQVVSAQVAYDTVFDRQGNEVVDPAQINVGAGGINGLGRFCSGVGIQAGGDFSFVEDIYICGEEDSRGPGGTVYVLDVDRAQLHAVVNTGRGSWENVSPVATGDPQTIGLLCSDDSTNAPLYLYVGVKNGLGDGSFLDRNGFKVGQLYYWKATNGVQNAEQFNTQGSTLAGTWEAIDVQDPMQAGQAGFDPFGFKDDSTLRAEIGAAGGFLFARPEDIHANPANSSELVFASTGRSSTANGADTWGTIYQFEVDFTTTPFESTFSILWDSDNIPVPDAGIRSPDNLTWADNGKVYINEDRATGLFGQTSGAEASIWELDPVTLTATRVGEMNRSVVLPLDATDGDPNDIGDWESSGVIDVTDFFATEPGETLLFVNVQAHSVRDGSIGDNANLDEGGQLFFMSNRGIDSAIAIEDAAVGTDVDFFVTNGTPGNFYASLLAFQNAGNAPNGFFFGLDVTFFELGFVSAPLFGMLDGNGAAEFTLNVPTSVLPLVFDSTVLELDLATGLPVKSGPAVTINL